MTRPQAEAAAKQAMAARCTAAAERRAPRMEPPSGARGRAARPRARRRGGAGAAAVATSALFRADAAHEQGPQRRVGVLQALGLPLDEPVEDDLVEGAEPSPAGGGGGDGGGGAPGGR